MKTIDVQARQWFDKTFGNSYFSAIVTIDYGMESETEIKIPFQYGYGDYYIYEALNVLKNNGIINTDINSLWRWCNENGVILRCSKHGNCLKRDVINFVK